MRRLTVLLAFVLALAAPVAAQPCGNGLPCGPVPWKLPKMPGLQSPTPMPTLAITAQATDVSGAVPTPAPMPTNPALNDVDTSGINNSVATLNALIQATAEPIYNAKGTEVAAADQILELQSGAGDFFSYAKGISTINLGSWTPLIVLLFVGIITIMSFKAFSFLLPFLAALFGLIRKIVQIILDFLPF